MNDRKAYEVVRRVPVSALVMDEVWNSRSARELAPGKIDSAKGPEDAESLYESIRTIGVQEPVQACAREDGKLVLVAGFRRVSAARRLSEETGTEMDVPVLVRSYEGQADMRRANLVENVARKNLYPVELARGLDEYRRALPEGTKVAAIASALGMQARWVANLLRIRDKGSKDLLDHWDRFPKVKAATVLAVLTLPKAEQLPALLAGRKKPEADEPEADEPEAETLQNRFEAEAKSKPEGWAIGALWLAKLAGLKLRAPKASPKKAPKKAPKARAKPRVPAK